MRNRVHRSRRRRASSAARSVVQAGLRRPRRRGRAASRALAARCDPDADVASGRTARGGRCMCLLTSSPTLLLRGRRRRGARRPPGSCRRSACRTCPAFSVWTGSRKPMLAILHGAAPAETFARHSLPSTVFRRQPVTGARSSLVILSAQRSRRADLLKANLLPGGVRKRNSACEGHAVQARLDR